MTLLCKFNEQDKVVNCQGESHFQNLADYQNPSIFIFIFHNYDSQQESKKKKKRLK